MRTDYKLPNDTQTVLAQPPEKVARWLPPDYRCELWTGERWIDLERDVLQRLDRLEEK